MTADETRSNRRGTAQVITEAEPSYDDQLRARRKRYSIMMMMRFPFLITAALLYQTPWLALIVIAVSVPLPWAAVLIANDRPARKRKPVMAGTINHQLALPRGAHVIEHEPDPAEH